jgi:hypothetical protein
MTREVSVREQAIFCFMKASGLTANVCHKIEQSFAFVDVEESTWELD